MLLLTRKKEEKIRIGDRVVLTVIEIGKTDVKLGFEAPKDITIHREEIYQQNLRIDGIKKRFRPQKRKS